MLNLIFSRLDTRAYQEYALEHFSELCRPRPQDSHKGTFGTVGVIGGAKGMSGAAVLAATAALYGGCGKVLVGFNQSTPPVCSGHWELMSDCATDVWVQHADKVDTWVVGCGLGRDETAIRLSAEVWNGGAQLVVDADALHILSENSQLFAPNKGTDLVLTPHPYEAAQLLDTSVAQIQSNRDWAARELASRYRAWVVLKGHETVISSARGFLVVNPTGNAGLATAGSGDVLAGLIGSLLAQKIPAEQAVPAAVWLHGAAADLLVSAQTGPVGLLAGELPEAVRWLRNRIISGSLNEKNT